MMAIAVDGVALRGYRTGNDVPRSCYGERGGEQGKRGGGVRWGVPTSHANFKIKLAHSGRNNNKHTTSPRPRCCGVTKQQESPAIIRVAVSATTSVLGFLRIMRQETPPSPPPDDEEDEDVRDPLQVLATDYARSYFVTGDFCTALYDEDCVFADPTISFTGREAYRRNLKLLVPFLVDPSVELLSMAEGEERGRKFIITFWTLRTYVKLPWMPLINVDGSTVYDLDPQAPSRVTRHEERWSVSAWEAVRQLLVPSNRNR